MIKNFSFFLRYPSIRLYRTVFLRKFHVVRNLLQNVTPKSRTVNTPVLKSETVEGVPALCFNLFLKHRGS